MGQIHVKLWLRSWRLGDREALREMEHKEPGVWEAWLKGEALVLTDRRGANYAVGELEEGFQPLTNLLKEYYGMAYSLTLRARELGILSIEGKRVGYNFLAEEWSLLGGEMRPVKDVAGVAERYIRHIHVEMANATAFPRAFAEGGGYVIYLLSPLIYPLGLTPPKELWRIFVGMVIKKYVRMRGLYHLFSNETGQRSMEVSVKDIGN